MSAMSIKIFGYRVTFSQHSGGGGDGGGGSGGGNGMLSHDLSSTRTYVPSIGYKPAAAG